MPSKYLTFKQATKLTPIECVKFYFPDLDDEMSDSVLWGLTCFPMCMKTTLKQLSNLNKARKKYSWEEIFKKQDDETEKVMSGAALVRYIKEDNEYGVISTIALRDPNIQNNECEQLKDKPLLNKALEYIEMKKKDPNKFKTFWDEHYYIERCKTLQKYIILNNIEIITKMIELGADLDGVVDPKIFSPDCKSSFEFASRMIKLRKLNEFNR